MKCLLLLVLAGAALAAKLPGDLNAEVIDTPDPYEFSLAVADQETGNFQDHQAAQDANGNVRGQFSWIDADGVNHITQYSWTQETGMVMETILQQTDIRPVVPVPTPAPSQPLRRL